MTDVYRSVIDLPDILSLHLTQTSSEIRSDPTFLMLTKRGRYIGIFKALGDLRISVFMFIFLCICSLFQKQWTMACITLIWLSFLMLGYDFVWIYDMRLCADLWYRVTFALVFCMHSFLYGYILFHAYMFSYSCWPKGPSL